MSITKEEAFYICCRWCEDPIEVPFWYTWIAHQGSNAASLEAALKAFPDDFYANKVRAELVSYRLEHS